MGKRKSNIIPSGDRSLIDLIKSAIAKKSVNESVEVSRALNAVLRTIMKLEKEATFEQASRVVIKHLNSNDYHPHMKVIITSTSAELLEGEAVVNTDEYLKD